MAPAVPRFLVVTVDRWFALGLLGVALMVLAALGEFVFHWWED